MHASAIENPVKHSTVMAAQLPQLSFYLRTMRKGQMWMSLVKKVHPLDLPIDRELDRGLSVLNKVIHRLGAVACSIELCDESARNSFAQFGFPGSGGFKARAIITRTYST